MTCVIQYDFQIDLDNLARKFIFSAAPTVLARIIGEDRSVGNMLRWRSRSRGGIRVCAGCVQRSQA